MRPVPEVYRLKHHPNLSSDASFGNNGFFVIPHHRITGYEYRCQVSDGEGWEHVSLTVAPKNKNTSRCPTWEEMSFIKSLFWESEDCVVQYHPPESQYVSMHPHCLHLWKPTEFDIPTPNPFMVGINLKTRNAKTS